MVAHSSGGKERMEEEWNKLLLEGGFARYNIIDIPALQSVIEAFPRWELINFTVLFLCMFIESMNACLFIYYVPVIVWVDCGADSEWINYVQTLTKLNHLYDELATQLHFVS